MVGGNPMLSVLCEEGEEGQVQTYSPTRLLTGTGFANILLQPISNGDAIAMWQKGRMVIILT